MDFSEALTLIKQGIRVTRSCWKEWEFLRFDIEQNQPLIIHSDGHPFFSEGYHNADVLATDWCIWNKIEYHDKTWKDLK